MLRYFICFISKPQAWSQNLTNISPTTTLTQSSKTQNSVMHGSVSKNVSCRTTHHIDCRWEVLVCSTNMLGCMWTNQCPTDQPIELLLYIYFVWGSNKHHMKKLGSRYQKLYFIQAYNLIANYCYVKFVNDRCK